MRPENLIYAVDERPPPLSANYAGHSIRGSDLCLSGYCRDHPATRACIARDRNERAVCCFNGDGNWNGTPGTSQRSGRFRFVVDMRCADISAVQIAPRSRALVGGETDKQESAA